MTADNNGISCECNHEASKLTFAKMFQNDNGLFGGEVRTILLDCECGDVIFIYSYRGAVHKQHVKSNSVSCHHKCSDSYDLKQQEIW